MDSRSAASFATLQRVRDERVPRQREHHVRVNSRVRRANVAAHVPVQAEDDERNSGSDRARALPARHRGVQQPRVLPHVPPAAVLPLCVIHRLGASLLRAFLFRSQLRVLLHEYQQR